jgi:hypothetical protein
MADREYHSGSYIGKTIVRNLLYTRMIKLESMEAQLLFLQVTVYKLPISLESVVLKSLGIFIPSR